ncbi:NADPH:quinone oxidoreductase family protein [Aeromicrobium alkaliterrae]|uniref:NADPH:quinone oxidoreductase family protein n=1 Tax=Aeromicrobium alkaliterrae TaxID=302168 RepID=A0ABP4VIH9_9ACTN
MRALLLAEHGGAEALRLSELPDPDGDGLVHLDVLTAGLSRPDLLLMRGEYQTPVPLPFVPGSELCGVVTAAPASAGVQVGDRVLALTPGGGAWAEKAVVPAGLVVPAPPELDDAEAAALPVNFLTAWFAIEERGGLREGETVLVLGAAGGLGSAAVQVAHALGAKVVAVVHRDGADETLRELGADAVVRLTEGWAAQVREDHGAVGVVIDPVGGPAFDDAVRVLAPGGRLVVLGFSGGGIPTVAVNRLLLRNVAVVGAGFAEFLRHDAGAFPRALAGITGLVAAGLRPHVGRVGSLDEGVATVAALDTGDVIGKAVIRVAPDATTPGRTP